jgi:hypothetical protein
MGHSPHGGHRLIGYPCRMDAQALLQDVPSVPGDSEPVEASNASVVSRGPWPHPLALSAWLAMHQGLDLQRWFEEQV